MWTLNSSLNVHSQNTIVFIRIIFNHRILLLTFAVTHVAKQNKTDCDVYVCEFTKQMS